MPRELLWLPPRGHDPYVGGTVMNDHGHEGSIVARRTAGPRQKYQVRWENGTRRWYFADRLRRIVVIPKEKR